MRTHLNGLSLDTYRENLLHDRETANARNELNKSVREGQEDVVDSLSKDSPRPLPRQVQTKSTKDTSNMIGALHGYLLVVSRACHGC